MDSPFKNMLVAIKARPSLYGITKVEDISLLITGVQISRHIYQVSQEDECLQRFHFHFSEWVEKHFEVKSTQGWVKIIRFYSQSDADSLDVFFKLFEDFNKSFQEDFK